MKVLIPHARGLYAAGFALVVLAGAAAGVVATRAIDADEWVRHTFEVRETAAQLLARMQVTEADQQGYLLTSNSDYLQMFEQALPTVSTTIARLRQLTADNPRQQQRLGRLQSVADAKLDEMKNTVALARNGGRDQAIEIIKLDRGRKLTDQFAALLSDFSREELDLLAARQATVNEVRVALLVLICACLFGALALSVALARTAQAGINRLRERTDELEAEVKLRRDTQDALRQSQKLESVGHLTGGIAHDFNNLLTIILGNLDIIKRRIGSTDAPAEVQALVAALSKPIESATQGARNAAQLTHRLLAFSRRQTLDPTRLDLNQLVSGISDLLRRTLGERVVLETVLAGGLWPTLADANQVESALINLCLNARDAMLEGGRLTVETGNAYLDETYARQFGDVTAGQYVLLLVSDTGSGIAPDVLERVFEPFFTTKPAGQGSGLGLAMVHGFVKQSGGHIRIYSELGHGTSVKIYLPRLSAPDKVVSAPAAKPTDLPLPRGAPQESILLVEDNAAVRDYARTVLEGLGYSVLEAADSAAALRVLETAPRIDLLFTDVVLPGISGRELANLLLERYPHLPILYTTGYTRNAIVHHGTLDPDVHLLSKPYTQQNLAAKVRELLDKSALAY